MKYPEHIDQDVLDHLVRAAKSAMNNDEKRFSIRRAIENARRDLKVSGSNNHHTTYTTLVVERVPGIADRIETRSAGRGKTKLRPQLARIESLLATGARIVSVDVEREGRRYRVALTAQKEAA